LKKGREGEEKVGSTANTKPRRKLKNYRKGLKKKVRFSEKRNVGGRKRGSGEDELGK